MKQTQLIRIYNALMRGAQPWVGRARWNFGSFYLWGDVPALMSPAWVSVVGVPGALLGIV